MADEHAKSSQSSDRKRQPYRVHLPGFLSDDDVGLGDVIKRATTAVGIQPCGGCARRAAAFNQWMVFTGGKSQQDVS